MAREQSSEKPRYKLTTQAYIGDVLYEPEQVITYEGVPGWHMEPENDAAREMKRLHPQSRPDPIEEMTSLKMADASVGDLATVMAQAMAQALGQAMQAKAA
jgi:hypothetical protein